MITSGALVFCFVCIVRSSCSSQLLRCASQQPVTSADCSENGFCRRLRSTRTLSVVASWIVPRLIHVGCGVREVQVSFLTATSLRVGTLTVALIPLCMALELCNYGSSCANQIVAPSSCLWMMIRIPRVEFSRSLHRQASDSLRTRLSYPPSE